MKVRIGQIEISQIKTLERLIAQAQSAIAAIQSGTLVEMTETKRLQYLAQYGRNSFVLDDFVIHLGRDYQKPVEFAYDHCCKVSDDR